MLIFVPWQSVSLPESTVSKVTAIDVVAWWNMIVAKKWTTSPQLIVETHENHRNMIKQSQ